MEALGGRWMGGGPGAPREPEPLRLESARLKATIDPKTGALTVFDRVTRRSWQPAATLGASLEDAKVDDGTLSGRLLAGFPCQLRMSLAESGADLRVELTPEAVLTPGEAMKPAVGYPPAFATDKGGRFALPRAGTPTSVPVTAAATTSIPVAGGLTAPWFGYGDRRGGYVVALETPPGWEASLRLDAEKGKPRTIRPVWTGSPESLGKTLAATLRFTSETGLSGLARVYQLLTPPVPPAPAGERSQ